MTPLEFERFLARLYASSRSRRDENGTHDSLPDQLDEPTNTSEPPEVFRFGPFELMTEIGRGGFGIVYLARDTRTGSDVAIKLPMPFVLLSQTARNRFLREGRVGETLDHPGIVKVFETGDFGGIVYIASEFVPGLTLSSWLADRKSPVPCNIAAILVARMAESLAHAHAHGIIHRDLKPANVILQPTGNSDESSSEEVCPFLPRVTDFGLAKVLHEIRNEQTLTGSAEIGSTTFMAPEQVLGLTEAIGPCTDIHALGAMLYRILAGQAPFIGQSREEVFRKIVHETPTTLQAIRPDVPQQLAIICDKCLRKEPANRYASAGELKSDLERFLLSEKILARPVSHWERGRKWIRRHPAIATAASLAVAFMIVVIVIQAAQNRRLRRINHELEISERRAEIQAKLAENRKTIVDRSFYETRLNAAHTLTRNGLVERAQQVLQEIDPGPGRSDFAWNHLWLMSRERMEVVAFADSDHSLMSLSPDGNAVAIYDKSKSVIVRDISTGSVLDRFEPFGNGATTVILRFSRDGRRLFCLSGPIDRAGDRFKDNGLVIRENRISRSMKFRTKNGTGVRDFEESAAGDRIRFIVSEPFVKACEIDFISLTDLRRGQEQVSRTSKFARLLPDGLHVLLADDGGTLRVASFENESVNMAFAPVSEILTESLAIDPYSSSLAISNTDRRAIRIFHFDSLISGKVLEANLPFEVHALQWIDGQKRLIAYDERWNAASIDPRSGSFVPLRSNLDSDPNSMDFTLSGQVRGVSVGSHLLTFGYAKNPGGRMNQVWNIRTGLESLFPFPDPILDARTMPDGMSVLVMNRRMIKRWWPGGHSISNRSLAGHSDEGWGACFAPDDSVLVTSSDDTDDPLTVRIWDWKTGELIRGFKPHNATVSCVETSPDGRIIATSALSAKENLALWDAKTGAKIADLVGHTTPVYNLTFASDGTRLASGDNKGHVIVWDVATGKAVSNTQADRDRIRGLEFMPGSRSVIATASESRHVRIWDTGENRILRDWETGGEMTTLAFVPNSNRVCAAESSGRLFVWDFESGELIRLIEGDGNRIRHMRFLPESTLLAAGDVIGQLHLWNVDTGIEIMAFEGHDSPINRVACSSDRKSIATIAHDGSVRLWLGHDRR